MTSLCHHSVTSINEDPVGTNQTESHLIHFSEESLSFQVQRHLHPKNVSIPLFTNMQHLQPSCHFQDWPLRLNNKQGCKTERGKDKEEQEKVTVPPWKPQTQLNPENNFCPLFSPRFQDHKPLFVCHFQKLPLVVLTVTLIASASRPFTCTESLPEIIPILYLSFVSFLLKTIPKNHISFMHNKNWEGERGHGSRNPQCEPLSSTQPFWALFPNLFKRRGSQDSQDLSSLFFCPQLHSLFYILIKQYAISSHTTAKAHFAYWLF